MNYQIQATFRNIVFNSRDVLGNNPKDAEKLYGNWEGTVTAGKWSKQKKELLELDGPHSKYIGDIIESPQPSVSFF